MQRIPTDTRADKKAAGKTGVILMVDTEVTGHNNCCFRETGRGMLGLMPSHRRARLDAGGRLSNLDDWRSGETVPVMATVAPFGGEVWL